MKKGVKKLTHIMIYTHINTGMNVEYAITIPM